MEKIYSFYCDCGRSGKLEGIFIADEKDIENITGQFVNFGEALGKHSEVAGNIEADDIEMISDDQEFIKKCKEIFKTDSTISGYNPLDYYEPNAD